MNVLIAKNKEECSAWKGVSVVLDLLCGSTTACALLEKGKSDILLFPDVEGAEKFAREHTDFEVFSEWNMSVPFQHDSPFLAGKSSAKKPGLLVSGASLAAFACHNSSVVFLGGFCNFFKLAKELSYIGQDVLLIPTSLFTSPDDVEDVLCAEAMKDYLQGIGLPERAVSEIGNTLRLNEYIEQGSKTAAKDAALAFKINCLDSVPQISFSAQQTFAAIHQAGTPAPDNWIIQTARIAEAGVSTTSYTPGEATQLMANVSLGQLGDEPFASVPVPNPAKKETEKTESKLTGFLKGVSSSVQGKATEFHEKVSSAEMQEKAQEAKSKIKGFFSNIVRSVKEEKEELEQAFFRKNQSSAQAAEPAPVTDDPLDNILKKTANEKPSEESLSQAESAVKETPAPQETVAPAPASVKQAEETAAPVKETPATVKADSFGGKKNKKAIVLFSGGLDSTTCLYWAMSQGYECEALTVSYGQRHDREVLAAQMIARNLGVKHHLITLNLPWLATSSLVDKNQTIPDVAVENIPKNGVPSTYVPGRNLMFLSIAGSLLDSVGAEAIVAGPNAIDFSGYPDCTPAFFKAAADALNRGTVTGVNEGIEVLAPLMRLSKAEIVKMAAQLKVPFELTWSCYAGGQKPCGHCDSCKLRAKGFEEAGVRDTALD